MPSNLNDVLRVDVIGDFDGTDELINVYQVRQTNVAALSDAEVLEDLKDFFEALYTIFQAVFTILTVYRRVKVFNVTTNTLIGELAFDTVVQGTQTGDPGAPGICVVANFNTQVPRVILRKFIGPVAEANLDGNGRLSPTATNAVFNGGLTLLSDIIGTFGSYRYGYLSSKTLAFEQPTIVSVENIPGYQRRRKQGRGS